MIIEKYIAQLSYIFRNNIVDSSCDLIFWAIILQNFCTRILLLCGFSGDESSGPVSVSLLMPLITKAELSRSEYQNLIDLLLNKQQENCIDAEWIEVCCFKFVINLSVIPIVRKYCSCLLICVLNLYSFDYLLFIFLCPCLLRAFKNFFPSDLLIS